MISFRQLFVSYYAYNYNVHRLTNCFSDTSLTFTLAIVDGACGDGFCQELRLEANELPVLVFPGGVLGSKGKEFDTLEYVDPALIGPLRELLVEPPSGAASGVPYVSTVGM